MPYLAEQIKQSSVGKRQTVELFEVTELVFLARVGLLSGVKTFSESTIELHCHTGLCAISTCYNNYMLGSVVVIEDICALLD